MKVVYKTKTTGISYNSDDERNLNTNEFQKIPSTNESAKNELQKFKNLLIIKISYLTLKFLISNSSNLN